MTIEVREYGCEGQRLLVEGPYSQAEVARLARVPKQRVSDWFRGKCRPVADERATLETATAVPVRAWDAPPLRQPPTSPAVVQPAPAPGEAAPLPGVADVDAIDLRALGLTGLERLASRIRVLEPSLPPRERVSALQAEARVLAAHEALRQKSADARAEYLGSAEFLAEVRALLVVVPGPAAALRAHLERLGIALPAAPAAATVAEDPPTSADDIDDLIRELDTARSFRTAKEPGLALAHTLGLNLEAHADAIAGLLLDDHGRAARLLALLEGTDEHIIRGAIERAMSVRDVAALPTDARRVVAELLLQLGHGDVASKIGDPHVDA